MDKVLHFTDRDFEQDVLQSDKPVLVDFWAEWCGPCHMLAPTVKELADEFDGKIKVGKINVDNHELTAARYRVRGIPTLILFMAGKEISRLIGVRPKHEIAHTIQEVLESEVPV